METILPVDPSKSYPYPYCPTEADCTNLDRGTQRLFERQTFKIVPWYFASPNRKLKKNMQ